MISSWDRKYERRSALSFLEGTGSKRFELRKHPRASTTLLFRRASRGASSRSRVAVHLCRSSRQATDKPRTWSCGRGPKRPPSRLASDVQLSNYLNCRIPETATLLRVDRKLRGHDSRSHFGEDVRHFGVPGVIGRTSHRVVAVAVAEDCVWTECCDCRGLREFRGRGPRLAGARPASTARQHTFRPLVGAEMQNKSNPLQLSVLMPLNSVKAAQSHAHGVRGRRPCIACVPRGRGPFAMSAPAMACRISVPWPPIPVRVTLHAPPRPRWRLHASPSDRSDYQRGYEDGMR